MLEQLKELLTDPRVVAFIGLLVGCYILRDVVRALFFFLDASRRRKHRQD